MSDQSRANVTASASWIDEGKAVGMVFTWGEGWRHCPHIHSDIGKALDCATSLAEEADRG